MPIPKARLKAIRDMPDSEIDYSDIPELTDEFWENAVIVRPKKKKPVSLRLDEDVLEWFKKQGKGYQTKMNAVLTAYKMANS